MKSRKNKLKSLMRDTDFSTHKRYFHYPNEKQYLENLKEDILQKEKLTATSELKTTPFYSPTYRNEIVKAVTSCAICGYNNVDALEIHHIDGNHENNAWSNITVLCANCHTLITKGKIKYDFTTPKPSKL